MCAHLRKREKETGKSDGLMILSLSSLLSCVESKATTQEKLRIHGTGELDDS